MTTQPPLQIYRNVGGVMGFHVALNMFSEEIETLLLNDNVLFATTSQQIKNKRLPKNSGFYSVKTNNSDAPVQFVNNLNVFPDIIFKMCNLIRDCTLYPELITPDYCYANTYPSKIGFQNHIDSSYRWGASVVGISLHAPVLPPKTERLNQNETLCTTTAIQTCGI
jgi:hypothetical protein